MITVTSFTEAGGHAVNEDAFVVERHPADPDCWLGFLADGQGGRAGGARAAQLACTRAARAALREPFRTLVLPSTWLTLLAQADRAVDADPEAGFTTLVGFCIAGGFLAGASCGDSAVWVRSAGEQPREVTAGQVKNPPVGSGAAPFVAFGARLDSPWAVLAVSDGVWKYVGGQRLAEALATEGGQRLLERLQGYARLRGGAGFPDDFTAVLFEGVG